MRRKPSAAAIAVFERMLQLTKPHFTLVSIILGAAGTCSACALLLDDAELRLRVARLLPGSASSSVPQLLCTRTFWFILLS